MRYLASFLFVSLSLVSCGSDNVSTDEQFSGIHFQGTAYPFLHGLEEMYLPDSSNGESLWASRLSISDGEFFPRPLIILNGLRTIPWRTDNSSVSLSFDLITPVENYQSAEFVFSSVTDEPPVNQFYFNNGRLGFDDVIVNNIIDHDVLESRVITDGRITVARLEGTRIKLNFSLTINNWNWDTSENFNNPLQVSGSFEGAPKIHQHDYSIP